MISKETITKRIQKTINSSGMTPTEVAKKAGLKQSTMSNWYNGKTNINLIDYIKICNACNTPNGVFNEREMNFKIPADVSEQAEELTKLLVEIHQMINDKDDSPFDVFLENARYVRKLYQQGLNNTHDKNHFKVAENPLTYGEDN